MSGAPFLASPTGRSRAPTGATPPARHSYRESAHGVNNSTTSGGGGGSGTPAARRR